MKNLLFYTFFFSLSLTINAQEDLSWYVLNNSSTVGSSITLEYDIVYQFIPFTAPNANKDKDVFIIFDNGKYLNDKTTTLLNYGPFNFVSEDIAIEYMYFTHKYDDPPPPPSIIKPLASSNSSINIFNPQGMGADKNIDVNKDAVPNEDLTVIIDNVDEDLTEDVNFSLKYDIVDDQDNIVFRNLPRLTPSKVFDQEFSYPLKVDYIDSIITGNTRGNPLFINFNIPDEYNNIAATPNSNDPEYYLKYTLIHGNTTSKIQVPIRTANDPNKLVLKKLCKDSLENYVGTFYLEFENNGQAPTQNIGAVLKLPHVINERLFLQEIKVDSLSIGDRVYNSTQISEVLSSYPSYSKHDSIYFDFIDNVSLAINENVIIKFTAQITELTNIVKSNLLDNGAIKGYSIFSDKKALDITYSEDILKESGTHRIIASCHHKTVPPPSFNLWWLIIPLILILIEWLRRLIFRNKKNINDPRP